MNLLKKAGLVCLLISGFWIQAGQGADEESDYLPINGACNLEDGIYRASLENGNEMSLTVSDNQLVQLSVHSLKSKGSWWFGTDPVWEEIQFNRLASGCSGSRWLFAWKGTSSSLDENSYPDYYGSSGVFSGFFEENAREIIVSTLKAQTNNLSVVVGTYGREDPVNYTLVYKEPLTRPLPKHLVPINDECQLDNADFKASRGNADYFLSLVSGESAVYVYQLDSTGTTKYIQKASQIITVCTGSRLITSWTYPQSRKAMLFAGVRTSNNLIEPLTPDRRFGLPHAGYETLNAKFERVEEGVVSNIYGD